MSNATMDFNDDAHLDVCQNIEFGLTREYEQNRRRTDSRRILALDSAKIAAKQQFGFAQNKSFSCAPEIQGIIERCVAITGERVGTVNDLTSKELVARLDKIKHAVERHSGSGSRRYDAFINRLCDKNGDAHDPAPPERSAHVATNAITIAIMVDIDRLTDKGHFHENNRIFARRSRCLRLRDDGTAGQPARRTRHDRRQERF